MVVACPKCHYSFDVPESELENLDPERAVMVVCPKCGERRKIRTFEKEVARLRKEASKARDDLAKAAERAVEEQRQAVVAHAAAEQARRREEDAKREGAGDVEVSRLPPASVNKGCLDILRFLRSLGTVAVLFILSGFVAGLEVGQHNGLLGLGVFAAILAAAVPWWIMGHVLRALAGIWSAVERTALAIEKLRISKDLHDSS